MLLDTVADDLRARRPSRNELFATTIVDLLKAARAGDIERVKTLLKADPRLLVARDPMGNTALIIAVNSGHDALADLLFDAGVEPGLHEAAAIGDSDRVRAALERDASAARHGFAGRLHAAGPGRALRSPRGHAASDRSRCRRESCGHASDRGHATPRRVVWTTSGRALLLIERGADVTLARGGSGWKRAGWTALHYAAGMGFSTLVQPLLDRGADPTRADEEGKTPLDVAIEANHADIVDVLRSRVRNEDDPCRFVVGG
jgi:cytohesin